MGDYPRALGPALRPLEQLLDDPAVVAIHVNGPDSVWITRSGGIERSSIELSAGKLRVLADAIARAASASDDTPAFSKRFPGGFRAEVVRAPAAVDGTVITLTRPPAGPPTPEDLLAAGSISEEAMATVVAALNERVGMVVAGPDPLSRKGLLVALAAALPSSARIAYIETGDVHPPDLPHLIRLRAGPEIEVSREQLLRSVVGLQADRLVLDDVGGPEAAALLADAAGAFSGCLVSLTSSSADGAVERLITLARSVGGLAADPAPLVATAFGMVIMCSHGRPDAPRVSEIVEIQASPGFGPPMLRALFRRAGRDGALVSTGRVPSARTEGSDSSARSTVVTDDSALVASGDTRSEANVLPDETDDVTADDVELPSAFRTRIQQGDPSDEAEPAAPGSSDPAGAGEDATRVRGVQAFPDDEEQYLDDDPTELLPDADPEEDPVSTVQIDAHSPHNRITKRYPSGQMPDDPGELRFLDDDSSTGIKAAEPAERTNILTVVPELLED